MGARYECREITWGPLERASHDIFDAPGTPAKCECRRDLVGRLGKGPLGRSWGRSVVRGGEPGSHRGYSVGVVGWRPRRSRFTINACRPDSCPW